MNQYLKSAVSRYEQAMEGKNKPLISPISKYDAEVMVEIIELFKKCGKNGIVEVLNSYKFRKDSEVVEMLMECNLNFGEPKESDELEELVTLDKKIIRSRDFVKIQDERIWIKMINSWGREERYCERKKDVVYSIVLNRVEKDLQVSKLPVYSNHKFDYDCIDKRDDEFSRLDAALLSSGLVNIFEV